MVPALLRVPNAPSHWCTWMSTTSTTHLGGTVVRRKRKEESRFRNLHPGRSVHPGTGGGFPGFDGRKNDLSASRKSSVRSRFSHGGRASLKFTRHRRRRSFPDESECLHVAPLQEHTQQRQQQQQSRCRASLVPSVSLAPVPPGRVRGVGAQPSTRPG